MAYNFSGSNQFENTTNKFTYGGSLNDSLHISYIITVIINIITSPCIALVNVLVIMAVIRRPRLQSYPNILLACLAATDVFNGLITQPLFILCGILELLGMNEPEVILCSFHYAFLRGLSICSCLHLMLITCERLIAIKFTLRYPHLVTTRSIKVAVITVWIVSVFPGVTRPINNESLETFSVFLVAFTFMFCILFIVVSYVILYLEVLRHRKMMKTQQLSQNQVESFAKEHKALKTTVFVVGAVLLCFVPVVFILVLRGVGLFIFVSVPWIRTFAILNSLLNPLIYCWRQEEMRKYFFRFKGRDNVHPTS